MRYQTQAYTYEDAAHLLRRAGFGGQPDEIEALQRLGPETAAEQLLTFSNTEADNANPHDFMEAWEAGEGDTASRRLRAWWLHRMIYTPHPLREKLTLFWHGHFPVSMLVVGSPPAMYTNNQMLRSACIGTFSQLLYSVMEDPAFLIYLNGNRSRKIAPNENLAREFFELFTIGRGQYTEGDVHDSARALTGWGITLDKTLSGRRFKINESDHDQGVKTVLGRTGNLGGKDIIDLASSHPATAKRITTKIWQFFVSEKLPDSISEHLVTEFKKSNGDIKAVLRWIFTSEAFYAPENRNALIKSPTEYVVGALRSLRLQPDPTAEIALLHHLSVMDQQYLYPQLQGWPGGNSWISTTTLVGRLQFVGSLIQGEFGKIKWPANSVPATAKRLMSQTLLGGEPSETLRIALEKLTEKNTGRDLLSDLAHLIMLSPEYHLA